MIDSALAGIGVAWVPESHVEEHLESGRLVHLLPDWSPAHTGASLFYPANCQPSPALALFVAAVRAWARNQF
ncbi:LysR substrate-binding domain-containing protein [Pseudomonas sp. S60]|uniref:LysR substrate-binding domain-containing protein n=1 Tax=Pseudomonas sp. S60 TaxID=211124 RepID=UPI001F37C5FC|nr:LysR substrate-binding domain-containing protein [Pseudomonas sp. S60]